MNTIQFDEATQFVWDVIIIGAGVAGGSLAIQTSRRGLKTLLIEAKAFPREKVCGGCLNQRAQASLKRLGILESLLNRGAVRINTLDLRIRRTAVHWEIPSLLSVRRSTLDETMVKTAIESGADFLAETSATVKLETADSQGNSTFRRIAIGHRDQSAIVEAKIVIAADGLTRSSLRELPLFQSRATIDSRIGVQAIVVPGELQLSLPNETLQMLVSDRGYVGLSHTDGGMLDLAAAIDPKAIHEYGGIATTIERILLDCLQCGVRLPSDLTWQATPHLTRSSSIVSSHRLLLVGDSIGYVEPFTGEGMSWALSSAEAALPFIVSTKESGWEISTSSTWSSWVQRQHVRKQRQCRWIARQLRRPRISAFILHACNAFPPIRATLIRKATS